MIRSYSVLNIRAVDEDAQIITGIATSPTPDRLGDIIEPLGVKYKNPLPLLWQHRSDQPVGTVTFDRPTKEGITFRAKLPKVMEAGALKQRIDEAWQSIKAGLVRAVSIGFRPVEFSFMDDGGIHFQKTEVLELSLVTIPANADATISTIKSIDGAVRREMGMMNGGGYMPEPASDESQANFMSRCVASMLNCGDDLTQAEAEAHCAVCWTYRDAALAPEAVQQNVTVPLKKSTASLSAASGRKTTDARPSAVAEKSTPRALPKEAKTMKTIQDQIKAFEASRQAKNARMMEIMQKAADAGETLDEATSDEYDTLEVELKKIDEHLARLNVLDKANKDAAVDLPVQAGTSRVAASQARSGNGSGGGVISIKANVPPEIPFVRYAMALMAGKGMRTEALDIARQNKAWHNTPEVELALSADVQSLVRAAQGAGTTLDATFASPLIAYQVMASEFIEYLRPATIIGRIPGLRRVPFNIQMPRQTSGSSTGWVGEQAPKPVSSVAFDTVTLRWAKAAAIVVLTEELVRFSNPSAEALVRQDMVDASAEFLDKQFVDPTVAAVTNVSPASITSGVSAVTPSGTTAAAFRADVKTLFGNFITVNLPTAGGVWIMHSTTALSLSLMLNSLGQPVFPNITAEGGTLLGYPVIVSQNIPATGGSPTDGYPLIFAIAREIMLADDGQVTIDASREASLQMDTAPDSPPTASTNMISLWQTNHVGLRAERYINWQKRRTTAVQYIQNAKYSE